MTNCIEINGLRKQFGPILAVDDVSFSVQEGEVLGFLGPNGAGKSTTMKMITGYLAPDGGSARVCGHDVEREAMQARRVIGYLPEGAPAWGDMTVRAFLDFIASVRELKGTQRRQALEEAIERTMLQQVLEQPIETLSKGFRRRVGLAQAIMHNPPVLILDEPTDGLDPNQKFEVRRMIRDMASDKCIIISTHILEEVNAICSRALIIARGRVVADGTPRALEARSRYYNAVCLVTARQALEEMQALISPLPDVASIEIADEPDHPDMVRLTAFPRAGRMIVNEIGEALRKTELPVREMTVDPGRLDEVFRSVTTEQETTKSEEGQAA